MKNPFHFQPSIYQVKDRYGSSYTDRSAQDHKPLYPCGLFNREKPVLVTLYRMIEHLFGWDDFSLRTNQKRTFPIPKPQGNTHCPNYTLFVKSILDRIRFVTHKVPLLTNVPSKSKLAPTPSFWERLQHAFHTSSKSD